MDYRRGEYYKMLASYIIAWSDPAPIDEVTVKRIKGNLYTKVIQQFTQSLKHPLLDKLSLHDIRGLSKMYFSNIQPSDELMQEFLVLQPYLENFLFLINHKGYFNNFPYAGGLYDQPYAEMQIYRIIQDAYWEVLKREMERKNA